MFLKRFTLSLTLAICAVCMAFGIVGCNNNEHVHTYSEDWTRSATEHWHEATCEHTDEKGDLGTHVDSDNNGKCDKCNYDMQQPEEHKHTFADTWSHDENTHWHAATCNDTTERQDEAPHVDEDDNQFCDVCGEFIEHVHKFSETEWEFDEVKHWRPAICTHKTEKGDENEHSFSGGVCECGVKASEIDVYNALTELEMTEDAFADWRAAIKADGVTDVRATEQGDIVYERDGNIEGVYVAERTVKVEAIADGDGLADVWFKVAYNNADYISENGTDALAVAKTDADGVAEITFKPAGGYTTYIIMLAEAKDVAMLKGEDENNVKVIPNRYSLQSSAGKGEVCDFTVGETDETDAVLGSLTFKYDMSWAASEKRMLTYERYYADPVTGAGNPIEKNDPDTFTASGNNTFDYLLFSPAHGYDWSSGNTSADFDKIADNFRKSASGVYEISFTVTGGASAQLYFWDGIDLANGQKEADGSPSNIYVKSVSGNSDGSSIDSSAFTGKNSVSITIEGYRGLEDFQLGIKCDTACQVNITVNRLGDYTPPPPEKLKLGLNTAYSGSRKGYEIAGASSAAATTQFELAEDSGITDGWYTLEVIPYDEYCIMPRTSEIGGVHWNGGSLYSPGVLMCTVGSQTTLLWQTCKDGKPAERYQRSFTLYTSSGEDSGRTKTVYDFKNVSLKGVVYLTSTSKISLVCNVNITYYADIKIETYNKDGVQTLEGSAANIENDTLAFVPATRQPENTSFEFGFGDSIVENTKYRILFTIPESYVVSLDEQTSVYLATLNLGGVEYQIEGKRSALWDAITFELHTKIKTGDKLKITSGSASVNIFMAEVNVSVSEIGDLALGGSQNIQFAPSADGNGKYAGIEKNNYLYNFTAAQSGKYRLHIELTDTMAEANAKAYADGWNSNNYTANLNALEICNLLPAKVGRNTKYMYIYGKRNFINTGLGQVNYSTDLNKNSVSALDIEFSLNSGEEILFNIANYQVYMGITLTVQYVGN